MLRCQRPEEAFLFVYVFLFHFISFVFFLFFKTKSFPYVAVSGLKFHCVT